MASSAAFVPPAARASSAAYVPPAARASSAAYTPPAARASSAAHASSGKGRSLSELADLIGPSEVTVTLIYPAGEALREIDCCPYGLQVKPSGSDDPPSTLRCEVQSFALSENTLSKLLRWFEQATADEALKHSVLNFPSLLSKEQRKLVHHVCDKLRLGSSSQGYGAERFIQVSTKAAKQGGVASMPLSNHERQRSKEIWHFAQEAGGDFLKCAHPSGVEA